MSTEAFVRRDVTLFAIPLSKQSIYQSALLLQLANDGSHTASGVQCDRRNPLAFSLSTEQLMFIVVPTILLVELASMSSQTGTAGHLITGEK